MIDLSNFKKAYVMAPEQRALDIIYFSDLVLNLDYLDFEFQEKKYFKSYFDRSNLY